MDKISLLKCPITGNKLSPITADELSKSGFSDAFNDFGALNGGLVESSGNYCYPIFEDIILLHEHYAFYTGSGEDLRQGLTFDKKRVFDYYNEVQFQVKDAMKIYQDSPKWVDYRPVSEEYLRHSFTRAAQFFPATGKYLLDIASGPIGLQEYIELSAGYEYRICIDISVNALIQAKLNLQQAGLRGIFICGDICNIPLQYNVCNAVLCQHTLYHLPKNDQHTAVTEMYRVAKPDSKIVIIYCWFYHSWFMNISLHFIQLYRIARHFAGKVYVKLMRSKPRLYFYAHSPEWFKKSFPFSRDIAFFCWRSTNKYFLDLYIHPWFFGRQILKRLRTIEDKNSRFMSTFGEYAAIVISKQSVSK